MDIFAGSLPFKLKEEDLKKLFEPYGEVTSVTIIIDKITRQNKGFGFVQMPNEEEAKRAIEALDGSEVMGRTIKVNESDKDKKSSPGTNSNRRNHFSKNSNHNNNSQGNDYKKDRYKNKDGFPKNNQDDRFKKEKRGRFRDDDRY